MKDQTPLLMVCLPFLSGYIDLVSGDMPYMEQNATQIASPIRILFEMDHE
jgi:hypothetical protein